MKLKKVNDEGSNVRYDIFVDDGGPVPQRVGQLHAVASGWLACSLDGGVSREHRTMVKAAERLVATLACFYYHGR